MVKVRSTGVWRAYRHVLIVETEESGLFRAFAEGSNESKCVCVEAGEVDVINLQQEQACKKLPCFMKRSHKQH